MITISNAHLNLQILEPGSSYQRSRFDWSGICQQIILKGRHTFCSQEATQDNPGTEGIGLSDEFGINSSLGYAEIAPGAWFPKIGIGFLQKITEEPYTFMQDYPIEPVKIQVEQGQADKVTFLQETKNQNGWGWKLEKTLTLAGPNLTIQYSLQNLGEKTIQTETYNHNFLAVNANPIGPDYQFQASFVFQPDQTLGPVVMENNLLSLSEIPQKYFYASQTNFASQQEGTWSLVHRPSGHGIRVAEQFLLFKFAIWGMRHVISPEFFLWINLQPGETQTWQRLYAFF